MRTLVRGLPLSFRQIEEAMAERGVFVNHTSLHRWSIKMPPVLAAAFRRRKHPMGRSRRMGETCVKVSGQWKYLYGAVDSAGDTIDFLRCAKGDHAAARAPFERATNLLDVPDKITSDKNRPNTKPS